MRCDVPRISTLCLAGRSRVSCGAEQKGNSNEDHSGNHGLSCVCVECAVWLATESARVSYVRGGDVFVVGCAIE